MSRAMQTVRQWVPALGGACEARIGHGTIADCEAVFKGAVGTPQRAELMVGSGTNEMTEELVRRELTSAGFVVERTEVPSGSTARQLQEASRLVGRLDAHHVTADDLVVAIGDADVLSVASNVCVAWCGGVQMAAIPLDLTALVEVAPAPRGIDLAAHAQVLSPRPACRYLVADLDLMDVSPTGETTLCARALMAQAAMVDSEQSFSRLWDRSLEVTQGPDAAEADSDVDAEIDAAVDVVSDTLAEQAADTLKTRGRIASSSALAVRQGLRYGRELAYALGALTELPLSTRLAEGLRFSARVSAGLGVLGVDDVLAQDELLERLGLPLAVAQVDAAALLERLKADAFLHSNRFQLALPQRIGRVRLSNVDDALLEEHLGAWCAARGR
ncbi:3-dehydroquinate synthase [Olsenella profusa DSM 13989]|uniref:3-dehydroquinate synthase n=1 Tax=Olsenella profusa TaxID=138595 RepID=UPI00278822BE|nr:3-dehydroquinate synthase [Olsenella profusa]MDP9859894.1 3-dehydroquinate synthase [Olsenella profusa DSM 13989]